MARYYSDSDYDNNSESDDDYMNDDYVIYKIRREWEHGIRTGRFPAKWPECMLDEDIRAIKLPDYSSASARKPPHSTASTSKLPDPSPASGIPAASVALTALRALLNRRPNLPVAPVQITASTAMFVEVHHMLNLNGNLPRVPIAALTGVFVAIRNGLHLSQNLLHVQISALTGVTVNTKT
jgi:hypothetical protein